MDDEVHVLQRPIQESFVADITLDYLDAVLLGVVELLHVEGSQSVAPRLQVPDQVYPQETGAAGYKNSQSIHKRCLLCETDRSRKRRIVACRAGSLPRRDPLREYTCKVRRRRDLWVMRDRTAG